MTAVGALVKAQRLLVEGRVQVLEVAPRHVLALVAGDSGRYRCGYRDGGWWCSCPAFGRCSHLRALRLVVPAPLVVATSVHSLTAGGGSGRPSREAHP